MPGMEVAEAPPPIYLSWAHYCTVTTPGQRLTRCASIANRANRKRLLSEAPTTRLTGSDVLTVMDKAKGRCAHCESLAVENRPSDPVTGAPTPWAQVGRRIGSLEHLIARFDGGTNDPTNLAWACLWCNTWKQERRKGALDHAGYYPAD